MVQRSKHSEDSEPYSSERFAFDHQPARVLVAWSPSATGAEAIASAAWLARTANVEVQCVTTFLRPWPSPSVSKLGSKYKKWFKKEAAACEKAVKKQLEAAGVDQAHWAKQVSIFADGTNEANLIAQAAQDYGADIVLLGSSAAASKGRLLAGSTADALLHTSPVPVGLIPRDPKLSKRGVTRLNFGIIGDEIDDAALMRTARLAEIWATPLRILALSPSGFGDPPISESLELPSDITLEWRERTLAVLDRCRDRVAKEIPNIEITTQIGSGNGWAGALDALKWKKGDLLCLGSSPMGAFERVFIGSQATEMLPYVSVPVLMIPKSAQR
ncbi:universal stress protein [Corynebacterium pelargi]|uniref:Universal stress protein family protein n=1 Tax=Corynebacterium pelargi TaxID=1471400 RepID=A0A410WBR0_9CORY|nr:universal stress protein [Corynebacterium pelargi]QAU53387.1 Universal stress protein family protein [Corynebacterium pelargi]GGG72839.1 universal stress protein [Corynebacterium pelargi]